MLLDAVLQPCVLPSWGSSSVDMHVCVHHQKGSEKPAYKTGASHRQFIAEMTVRYDGI